MISSCASPQRLSFYATSVFPAMGARPVDLLAALLVVAVAFAARLGFRRKRLPLPPGPRGLPILGNIYDLPKSDKCLTYRQWARDFKSDIIHLNICGTSFVVVNSMQAAHDLFDCRSSIYSDRPRMVMLKELVGFDYSFGWTGYGDYWRERRKVFHQFFHPAAVVRFKPQMTRASHGILARLLDTPDDFMEHLSHMAGSTIMDITYGLKVEPKDDPYILTAKKASHAMLTAGYAGAYLVDYIPQLVHVPSWFPGAGFKRQASEWKDSVVAMIDAPVDVVKQAMAEGRAAPSMVLSLLNSLHEGDDNSEKEKIYREAAAAAWVGQLRVAHSVLHTNAYVLAGTDPTVATLATLILALLLFPEVQRKAQEELDRVVGSNRLPDLSDQPALPYITAIIKETLRWHPTEPLVAAHMLSAEDVYKGYRIPASSHVVGNAWAMLHDENIYPEPSAYRPERFLTSDGQLDPAAQDPEVAFGFGRRICPGRHMAMLSMWLTAASVLSTFTLAKPLDGDGNVIEPREEYSDDLLACPLPFKCSFKPRSKAAEALIRSSGHD
ncbi:cytochrome P450 [Amylocystis lapponica]|nr:cytochrome P450 [Amylocystis lapponica]